MTHNSYYTLKVLLDRWNHATAPYINRSEHKALRCRQWARAIDHRLSRMGLLCGQDWKETENGKRYPILH